MNKRFFIFAGSNYYPSGGWGDFKGSTETVLDALRFVANLDNDCDWWQIVDTTTNEVVERSNSR